MACRRSRRAIGVALADAVVSVMTDGAAYEAQSVRSLASARRYSWDRAAAGTLDAIERTVRGWSA